MPIGMKIGTIKLTATVVQVHLALDPDRRLIRGRATTALDKGRQHFVDQANVRTLVGVKPQQACEIRAVGDMHVDTGILDVIGPHID